MTRTQAIQAMLNGEKVCHPRSNTYYCYASVQEEFIEVPVRGRPIPVYIHKLPTTGWSLYKEPVEVDLYRWIVEYQLDGYTFVDYTPFSTSVCGAIHAIELKTGGHVIRTIKCDDATVTVIDI